MFMIQEVFCSQQYQASRRRQIKDTHNCRNNIFDLVFTVCFTAHNETLLEIFYIQTFLAKYTSKNIRHFKTS